MTSVLSTYFLRRQLLAQWKTNGSCRYNSTAPGLVDAKFDENKGYAVLSMQNNPVNLLSRKLNQELTDAITELELRKCRGIILTSNFPNVFCAGLDIKEVSQTSLEMFKTYWTSFQTLCFKLYGSKMSSVAVVNGRTCHAPAAGCVLALTCDYRIMVSGSPKIGLNEAKIGLPVPNWVKQVMVNIIGVRQTDLALQLGTLFSAEQALQIGLVDQIAPDVQSALNIGEEQLQKFLQIPNFGREVAKMQARENALKSFLNSNEADFKWFSGLSRSPEVKEILEKYLKNLAKRG